MKNETYGNMVKEARLKKGLTQSELAEKCHLGLRTVQRIENGTVKPRIQTVKLLNEFLEIEISDFRDFSSSSINYKVLLYLGISVLGLGIIFVAAVNVLMGAAFIAIGFLNVFIGAKNMESRIL